ncbi:MAG: hypothetical protein WBW99_14595 [Pseudolabrys sp.]
MASKQRNKPRIADSTGKVESTLANLTNRWPGSVLSLLAKVLALDAAPGAVAEGIRVQSNSASKICRCART